MLFFFGGPSYLLRVLGSQKNRPPGFEMSQMTDHEDEEGNDEGGEDEGEDEAGMMCDGVGNAPPLISLKKRTATKSGGVGDDQLLSQSAATISGGVGNAPLLR